MISIKRIFITFLLFLLGIVTAQKVVVETTKVGDGEQVTRDHRYQAHVTLYIEDSSTKEKRPSGWSTRKEDGAQADKPFAFQPGVNLIVGWTEGVLQMKEGERALLHVPSNLGYGSSTMGSPGGAFYIPANSDLLFDIEILSKQGQEL
jgi:FKBP-type peptidyl-prolyl cis-trans isomerase